MDGMQFCTFVSRRSIAWTEVAGIDRKRRAGERCGRLPGSGTGDGLEAPAASPHPVISHR
ncbi:hypothetical protein ACWGRF_08215 [Streptomyces zhihengii]